MSPRTNEQYEEIREQSRTRIMDAALELFARNSFHATSISMIAKEAGISKGLMYNYFESKEALLHALIEEGIGELTDSFDRNNDGVLTDDEFEFFVRKMFEVLKTNQNHWKLYFAIILQPGILELMQTKYGEILHSLMLVLTDYFKRKEVPNPELEARLFGSLLDGIGFNYFMDPEGFPEEEMIQLIIEKFSCNHKKQKK